VSSPLSETEPDRASASPSVPSAADVPKHPLTDSDRKVLRILGLRFSAIAELTIFLVLAIAADFYLGDGDRFWDVAPHPFWLIVIALSVQYGTNEGIFAAVCCTTALLAWNLPDQGVGQDLYDYLFEVTLTPIMWFAASVLFGELRVRQIRERDELRRGLNAAIERERVLSQRYRELDTIKDRLEERVAGQLKTVYSTYQAAREIESLGVGRVLLGMSNLVESILSPKKHSIFLLKGTDLQSTFGKGWSRKDTYSRAFDSGSPLFQTVIGRQEIVTIADPVGEKILDGEGVLAGPLIDHETGEVVGMLKIEELGFLDYNLGTIESFRILCEWLAAAYSNARNFERAKTQAAFDPEINMMSAGIYDRMSKVMSAVARRVGFDVSMLLFQISFPSDATSEERRERIRDLGVAVETVLRNTDVVFNRRQGDYDYTVILPNTSAENADIVAQKMRRHFVESGDPDQAGMELKIAVQALYTHDPQSKSPGGT